MAELTDEQKAAAAKAASLAEAEARTAAKRKVRVIAEHGGHKIDEVLALAPAAAKAAVEGGWADDHPDAVKYAERRHTKAEASE